jgi:hypothetical protein
MADNAFEDVDLPPPGSRWGTGARSVLPYLTKSLQAKPAANAEARETQAREAPPARKEAPPHRLR